MQQLTTNKTICIYIILVWTKTEQTTICIENALSLKT